ncbi:hypothetical protein [Brevibacterium aurantiacum]|uniref:hypothetical protein n=1 Tax=Brevibacterium aurantiacum TaxID=273384 RepID=UPI003F918A21
MYGYPVTVIRVRPGEQDRWGDREPDSEVPIEGGTIAPSGTVEDGQFRQSATSEWTYYAPPDEDIRKTDRFRLPARYSPIQQLWEVVGETAVWVNPFTGEHPGDGVELKRRSG